MDIIIPEYENAELQRDMHENLMVIELHKFNKNPVLYCEWLRTYLDSIHSKNISECGVDLAILKYERFDLKNLTIGEYPEFDRTDFARATHQLPGLPNIISNKAAPLTELIFYEPYFMRPNGIHIHIDDFKGKRVKRSWSKKTKELTLTAWQARAKLDREILLYNIPKIVKDYLELY